MKTTMLSAVLLLLASTVFCQSTSIRVEKSGKGKPLLLLPGFASPASVWSETIKNLKGSFECHAVSYPGFNGVAPIALPWYETIKRDLIGFIQSQKITRVWLMGHSMGGNLAVDIAAELPDVVVDMIIVDALPCMRELWMPGVPASALKYDTPYNKQMLALSDSAFLQNAKMMAPGLTTKKDKADELIECFAKADRETYVYGYTDLLKLDLREPLKKVKARTLILGAAFPDRATVTDNFQKQYANLTNKTLEIAEDSRHYIMFDQPEWFYTKVNSFFNR
jgi:pimeloyl-ACP methyl ester carboxylesterase